MHDFLTVKKLSDAQLQDLMQNLYRKVGGVSSSNAFGTAELILSQVDVIINELQERRYIEQFKASDVERSINLTVDPLSEQEDCESKNKEQKN